MSSSNKYDKNFVIKSIEHIQRYNDAEKYLFTFPKEVIVEFAQPLGIEEEIIESFAKCLDTPPYLERRRILKAIVEKVGR